jgi:hypothetical protein
VLRSEQTIDPQEWISTFVFRTRHAFGRAGPTQVSEQSSFSTQSQAQISVISVVRSKGIGLNAAVRRPHSVETCSLCLSEFDLSSIKVTPTEWTQSRGT